MEALILVATLGGPTMFARIGVMRALNRHVERVFDPSRKIRIGDAASWRGIDDEAMRLRPTSTRAFQRARRRASGSIPTVAFDADSRTLIKHFRIIGWVKIGRALVCGSSRFLFRRARGHDESYGYQNSEASHEASTRLMMMLLSRSDSC